MGLYAHQNKSISKFKDQNLAADLSDPGTGKTRVQIELLLYRKSRLNLIIAPKSTMAAVWQKQLDEFFVNESQILLNHGSARAILQLQELRYLIKATKRYYNVIVSYDTVPRILKELSYFYWGTIIADESTKMKNPKAKRTKAIIKLSKRSERRSIMTGTVAPNSLMDIFPQYHFLSDKIFGKNWYWFREQYFKKSTWNEYEWNLRPGSVDKIKKKIAPYSVQHKKKDCLDLPPVVQEYRTCEMSAEQKKLYKQMKDEMIVFMNETDEPITAPFVITKLMKMRQISAGFIYDTEAEKVYPLKNERIKLLLEIIEQINGKIIIFAHFKQSIKMICDALTDHSFGFVQFTGRNEEIEQFRDEKQIFVANPMSAGHGLNLQFASDIIYYEKDFNLETYLQSIDRINRIGQENKMTVYHIEASKIDKHITARLAAKEEVLKSVDVNKL